MEHEHPILLTSRIKPDHAFYVQGDDRLYVGVFSSVASLVVRVSGYFLSANGEVNQYAIDVAPTSDRVETSRLQVLGEGFVLSCMAHLLSGNANRGQCYVRARIQRGTATTIVPIVRLLGGYVTDDYGPSWPWGKIEGPLEGRGCLRDLTGSNPAAGAEWSETVPTGARWRVYAVGAALTTDATVANRAPSMVVDNGTTVVMCGSSVVNQPASGTYNYVFQPYGADTSSLLAFIKIQVSSPIYIPAGGRLRSITSGLVAGDDWAAPVLHIEEWIEA